MNPPCVPFLLQDIPTLNSQVFGACDLGDKRRESRLLELGLGHLYFPGLPFRRMFPEPAQSKGAYRFVENPAVSVKTMMEALTRAGAEACRDQAVIYVVQDTTTLDFSGRAPLEGLGPLNTKAQPGQGLFVHSALALTEAGVPLGPLDIQRWARDPAKLGQRERRRQRPYEEKESVKWQRGLEGSEAVLREVLGEALPRRIHVADRESDVYRFLHAARAAGVGLVVRACWNRRVRQEAGHLWETLRAEPVGLGMRVEVKARGKRKARTARLDVRWSAVTLLPPPSAKGLEPVGLWAVWVKEIDPPEGQEGLEWMLLTTEPVETAEAAEKTVRIYRLRQRVEDLHLILKSGCKMEEVQYESRENLERVLVLKLLPALRILALRHWGQVMPEAPARLVLDPVEEEVLKEVIKQVFHREKEDLTVKDVWEYLGRLGGHVQWNKEQPAGVRALWRGWEKFQNLVQGFKLARGLLPAPPPTF